MKTFSCRDIGKDCDWQTSGEDDATILRNAEQHGREKHGLTDFTQDIKNQVLSKIRDMKAA
jgi:predicted small metal-binding protein